MKRSPFLVVLALLGLLVAPLAGCSGETAGEYIDDSVISNKVRAELIGDSDLNVFQIDVNTLQGEVQLSGFVDSEEAKARAGRVAAGVEGVREVHNDLVVQ